MKKVFRFSFTVAKQKLSPPPTTIGQYNNKIFNSKKEFPHAANARIYHVWSVR